VPTGIPNSYVNPKSQHVGVSKLRGMNASNLRDLEGPVVIQENDKPIAVLVRFEEFLKLQQQAMAVLETEALLRTGEAATLLASLADAKTGKAKPLDEVRHPSGKPKEKS